MRFTAICALLAIPVAANSQELHEWKSKSGHSTQAALLKVDEKERKIVLFVPKEISFDALDDDSLALARKLAKILAVADSATDASDPLNQPEVLPRTIPNDRPRPGESDPRTWSSEQKRAFQEIRDSPPDRVLIKCAFYLGKYEPELAKAATDSRNDWQEAALEGNESKLRKHYAELRALLGDRFIAFYWDVHDIMSDDAKIRKLLQEAEFYRNFNGLK